MRAILVLGFISALLFLVVPAVDADAGSPVAGGDGLSVFRTPSAGVAGLLDPAKLSMSNQVSFLYSSGTKRSPGGGVGFYQNQLSYQVSDPLNITLLLGYQFSSPVGPTLGDPDRGERFLPGLQVSWQPSDNLFFRFEYRSLPSTTAWPLYGPRN